MAIERLRGVYAPIVTPCDEQDRLDLPRFEEHARRLFAAGVHGLYVCGGTGDAFKLTADERMAVCAVASRVAREYGRKNIVHVGSPSLRTACELARHAAADGACAVSAIPPAGLSGAPLKSYYEQLAEAADLPVVIYHIPAMTHYTPSFDELMELLSIPGVAGIKMTDWNLFLLRRIALEKPDAVIYSGYDELLALGLSYGAHGAIGTWCNLVPGVFLKMYELVGAGKINEAMRLQYKWMDFLSLAWKHGVIGVFEAIMKQKGYAERCFRSPSARMSGAAAAAVLPALLGKLEEAVRAAELA